MTWVVTALAMLVASGAAEMISAALEDCNAMDTIELNMLRPRIAECRASSEFQDATANDALCGATTTCGNLLPYLAYMEKAPCFERAAFSEFSQTLLTLCDAYPYRTIDPKSVLVGKPRRTDLDR